MATSSAPLIERLKRLEDEGGIGLVRGDVKLAAYHPCWKHLFADEAYAVFDALKIDGLRLYHIGSTSIPGIVAKPVIDILGSVDSHEELDQRRSALEELGYEYKGEYGIEGRRYCVLYDPKKTKGYVHLHIFEHGSPQIESHLLFRDYLRVNQSAAKKYEQTKLALLEQKVPREQYPDLKSPVLKQLLAKAQKEIQRHENVLAILGSEEDGRHTSVYLAEYLKQLSVRVRPFAYSREMHASEDAYIQIVDQMIASDLIVLATPVYGYAMSGIMKDFMDRFFDLLSGNLKKKGEDLYGKKIVLLATGHDEELPHGFEVPFSRAAIYFGMDYMGSNYRSFR